MLKTLNESGVDSNPISQFDNWWQDAIKSMIEEVNAMTLATATREGKPSARIVLLKEYNEKGFVFFTNYESHKGKELDANPQATIVFFWKELERPPRCFCVTTAMTATSAPSCRSGFLKSKSTPWC